MNKCSLLQVETVIAGHELVAESAVVGFPHEVKGESICAFVTLKEEAAKVLKNDVGKQVPNPSLTLSDVYVDHFNN